MNERIQKLVEQAEEWVCKNYPDAMDDNDEFHAQTMAKFAELIVAECVSIADEYDGAGSTIVSRIKKHFEVEQ